ncbi:NXPE family member 3-like [Carassius gibelio]|uniref:NXPE family member 3-like n=1 Tax=Carassius gibelio TaxID=101364 RepID=UPI0022782425|nr:NXPE family member 3-like [Carassius gibelio]
MTDLAVVIPSTMRSNTQVYGLRKDVLLFACSVWITFCLIVWRMSCFQISKFDPPAPKEVPKKDYSLARSVSEMGISDEEWERLQKALNWPGPDQQITQLNLSTSPVHSTFSIVELKKSYKVGDNISVIITARDHNKNLKRYGGDFFKAKLFNSELKASVYGEVVDHRNGTYSVVLLLPWEGQAQVFVRLEHSSEVVQILKKYRQSSFPRSHYNGHFEGLGPNKTRISEVVECNLKWGGEGSWRKHNCCCEYKDIKTGTVWQCERPKKLPCDKLVYHSKGGTENPLNPFEKQFFAK